MAAKKKKKTKKAAKKAKAGAPAKTGATKKKVAPAKKPKKSVKKAVAKKAPAKKAKKPAKKTVKAVAKSAPAKKKQVVGEGDYAATRKFDADQASFVKKNKAKIPEMGKAAEAALEGPEGDALRDAEAAAAGRSRDTFDS